MQVSQSFGENGPVRAEVSSRQFLRSLENFLMRQTYVEYVGWVDAISGHQHSLLASAREVFNYPAIL